MGGGLITVRSTKGQPIVGAEVSIDWTLGGLSTGNTTSTTNSQGEVLFEGVPPFSAGHGEIKGGAGDFAKFNIGSDHFGNFAAKSITVTWNPTAAIGDTLSDAAKAVYARAVQILVLLSVLGVIGLVVYSLVKKAGVISYVKQGVDWARDTAGKVRNR